jgi:hypothetical protein
MGVIIDSVPSYLHRLSDEALVTPQATTASKEKTIAQFVLLPVMDDDVVI